MNWFVQFLTSSIGKKLIMSLTGLSLILFLPVHLLGNIQLLFDDGGAAFNEYAHMMGHNPIVQLSAKGLYFFILLHAIQGILIWLKNRDASGGKYAVKTSANATWASKSMAWLGILIFIFLCIHMGDFWYAMKFGDVPLASGTEYKDLYAKVSASFSEWWLVVIYVISMIGLMFHLLHGFASAFQTLGLNHKKYTPFIELVGKIYSIGVCVGFAIIPIYFYFAVAQ